VASTVIVPVLNLMEEGLGVGPTSARLIVTTPAICIAIFSPLCGDLIDRIGAKKPFVFGLLIYGVSGGAGLLIADYWLLLVSRVMLGISVAAIIPSMAVIIFNLYKEQQRNTVMGWRTSSQFSGNTVWPLLGGFLGTFSWHTPFAIYLLGIPVGIIGFLAIPDIHRGAFQSAKHHGNKESVLRLIRNTPALFIIYGVAFLSMVFLFAMILFMPKIVEQFGVVNPFHIGIFISILWLTAIMTSLVYGRIKTLLSYRALLVIILFLWVAGFIVISQASSIWMIGISVVLIGLCQGIVFPTVTLWAGESVPTSFLGRIISYNTTVLFIGQFLSPIILSPIASSLGLNAVFIIIGGISALLLVAFLVFFRGRIIS